LKSRGKERIDNVKNGEAADKEKFIRILLAKYEARNKISNDWVRQQLESHTTP
jgi:hypothetical protein